MKRRAWLLALLYAPSAKTGRMEIDGSVQLNKELFLLGQKYPDGLENFYSFRPYLYGPHSPEIDRDIETLRNEGLLETDSSPGRRTRRYRLTSRGIERGKAAFQGLPRSQQEAITKTRAFVEGQDFLDLLAYIYERYPQFAERSVIEPRLVIRP